MSNLIEDNKDRNIVHMPADDHGWAVKVAKDKRTSMKEAAFGPVYKYFIQIKVKVRIKVTASHRMLNEIGECMKGTE